LSLYKDHLQFYPKAPNVAGVRQQIARLEVDVAAERAKTPPPASEPEPKSESAPGTPTPPPAEPAPTTTAAAPALAPAPPEKPRTPIYKKWWLWTAVGAVVLVAVIVPVAVVETRGSWNNLPDVG